MRSLPVNFIAPRYVADVLLLPVGVSFAFDAVRARAGYSSDSLLLRAVLRFAPVLDVVRRLHGGAHHHLAGGYGRGRWLDGGGDVLQNLPLAGVRGVLLDLLAHGQLGRLGLLGDHLHVPQA